MAPADIRLITRPDDPYKWNYLPEKDYLFRKPLSKHSIRAYTDLYNAVGVSIEAVPHTDEAQSQRNDHGDDPEAVGLIDRPRHAVSFAARIQDLQAENARLQVAAKYWQTEAETESRMRGEVQLRLKDSRARADKVLGENRLFRDRGQRCAKAAGLFRQKLAKAAHTAGDAMHIMQRLQTELSPHCTVPMSGKE